MRLTRQRVALIITGVVLGTAITGSASADPSPTPVKACQNASHVLALLDAKGNCPAGFSKVTIDQQGPAGPGGNTILSGAGRPDASLGNYGDVYLDTVNSDLYGPKFCDLDDPSAPCVPEWGVPISLVGPAGDRGPAGPQGQSGASGLGLHQQTVGTYEMTAKYATVLSFPVQSAHRYLIDFTAGADNYEPVRLEVACRLERFDSAGHDLRTLSHVSIVDPLRLPDNGDGVAYKHAESLAMTFLLPASAGGSVRLQCRSPGGRLDVPTMTEMVTAS